MQKFAEKKKLFGETEFSFVETLVFLWNVYQEDFLRPGWDFRSQPEMEAETKAHNWVLMQVRKQDMQLWYFIIFMTNFPTHFS